MGANDTGYSNPPPQEDDRKPSSLFDRLMWVLDRPLSMVAGGAKSAIDGSEFDPRASVSIQDVREAAGKKIFGEDQGKLSTLSFGHNDGGKLYADAFASKKDAPYDAWVQAGKPLNKKLHYKTDDDDVAADKRLSMIGELGGDVADTVIDFYAGQRLDPLSYLGKLTKTFDKIKEAKRFANGVKMLDEGVDIKPVRNVYDGAVDSRVGSYFLDNSLGSKAKRGIATGGLAAGMALHEDSGSDSATGNTLEALTAGTLGSLAGIYGRPFLTDKMASATHRLDQVIGDYAAKVADNPELANYGESVGMARLAQRSVNLIAKQMQNVRKAAMAGLSPNESVAVEKALEFAKSNEVKNTNNTYIRMLVQLNPALWTEVLDKNSHLYLEHGLESKEFLEAAARDFFGKNGGKANAVVWNAARKRAFETAATDPEVADVLAQLSPKAKAAFDKRVSANLAFVDEFNRVKGRAGVDVASDIENIKFGSFSNKDGDLVRTADYRGKDDPNKLLGLKHHTDAIFIDDMPAAEELKASGKYKFSDSFYKAWSGTKGNAVDKIADELFQSGSFKSYDDAWLAARDLTYDMYSRRAARKFLTEEHDGALRLVNEARQAIKANPVVRGWDDLTAINKKSLLTNSVSWLKNNFWDNTEKAVMENGFDGFLDSVGVNRLKKGLMEDVEALQSGKPLAAPITNDKAFEYAQYGVVDSNSFQDIAEMTDSEKLARFTPEVLERMKKEPSENWFSKGWQKMMDSGHAFTDNPLSRKVSAGGSYIENRSRIQAYERFKSAILESDNMRNLDRSPEFKEELARIIAAQNTNRVFIDYGAMTAGETEIVKRALPFYGFAKGNTAYWWDTVTDPNKLAKIAAANRLRTGGIAAPEGSDREHLKNSYLKNANPRVVRKNGETTTFLSSPSSSFGDAMNNLLLPFQATMDVVNDPKRFFSSSLTSNDNPMFDLLHPIPKKVGEQVFGRSSFFNAPLNPDEAPGGRVSLGKGGYVGSLFGDLLDSVGINRNFAAPVGGYRNAATGGSGPQTDAEGTSRFVNALTGAPPVFYGWAKPANFLTMPIVHEAAKQGHGVMHNGEGYSVLENLIDMLAPVRLTTVDNDTTALGEAAAAKEAVRKQRNKTRNDTKLNQTKPGADKPKPVKGWDY